MANFLVEREALSDRLSFFVLSFSLVSFIAQVTLIALYLRTLPPQVPLYYSRTWGEAMLASPLELFLIPGSLLVIFIVNWIITRRVESVSQFLVKMLLSFTLVAAVGTLIGTVKIILLIA